MSILAYHFVGDTLRDGRPVPPNGEWLVYEGPVEICVSGLHASRHPLDALQYAPGSTLCLVEVEGDIIEQHDMLVGCRRRIIKRVDAGPLMREFARWCALQVVDLWDAPDVVRRYLATGDESQRDAVLAAAWAAAKDAARDAAWAAARDAARDAAWAAARDAAWAAAWDAALAAAWAAARDAARDAALGAVRDTAWAVVRDAQRDRFKEMTDAALGAHDDAARQQENA